MYTSTCVCLSEDRLRGVLLRLSPPLPPAVLRENHYGLTHFNTFGLKNSLQPCDCSSFVLLCS